MTRLALPLVLALAALAGCSSAPRTPEYACALNTPEGGKCASVQDAYRASRSMTAPQDGAPVQSVFDPRVQQDSRQAAAPMFNGQPSNYPDPGQNGMPVFTQPKVMRVWVAPYVDADGNLRSGEYTYFSTPGTWNYGTLNKPGAASGIFEPSRPDNLGFKPNVVSGNRRAGSTSGGSAAPSAPPAPAEQGRAPTLKPAPTATSGEGITQPYKRLSE